jgi:signal transduction histidine kinase
MIRETEAIEFSEPEKALTEYGKIYDLSISKNYDAPAFKAILYSAFVYNNLGKYDSALLYFNEAEKINLRIKDPMNDAYVALNKANTYMFRGDLKTSIENHLFGIAILEKQNDSTRLSRSYSNLSSVYQELDDFDRQIEYLNKSLMVTPKNDLNSLGLTHCDLMSPYVMKKDFEKALFHIAQADSISKLKDDKMLHFFVTRNWGDYYLHLEKHGQAIPFQREALSLAREYQYSYYENDLAVNLADALLNIGQYNEAENLLLNSLKTGNKDGLKELSKKSLLMLSVLKKRQGDYKSALEFSEAHNEIKDSLISDQNIKVVNELDKKYQTQKKDKEIAEQKLALSVSQSKTRTMSILIVSLLIASILLWFLFQQRQKRIQQQLVTIQREQEVRTLESLMEGEEKERFRIAKELHDGVNGDLSAIKFKLSSLLEMNNTIIKEAVDMIDSSCDQVRAISHNLVPPSLKDFNLAEAIEAYCQNMNSIHEQSIDFQQVGISIEMDKKQEANIFRIVQELVTNSIKHAEASEILVQLSRAENEVMLSVEDNGKGFDVNNTNGKGIGMQNLKSRAAYLNGKLDIKSDSKGTATTITFETETKKA